MSFFALLVLASLALMAVSAVVILWSRRRQHEERGFEVRQRGHQVQPGPREPSRSREHHHH